MDCAFQGCREGKVSAFYWVCDLFQGHAHDKSAAYGNFLFIPYLSTATYKLNLACGKPEGGPAIDMEVAQPPTKKSHNLKKGLADIGSARAVGGGYFT